MTAALTPPPLRRTLASTMPAGFDATFARVKELVADFRANEKFHLSPTCRCAGLDRQIDALVCDLYLPAPRLRQAGTLTPAEIKIVEGTT
jgi:hypothetical protein